MKYITIVKKLSLIRKLIGKRLIGSHNGKRSPPPVDNCNIKGVENALRALNVGIGCFIEGTQAVMAL